jgi:hypothetical protein
MNFFSLRNTSKDKTKRLIETQQLVMHTPAGILIKNLSSIWRKGQVPYMVTLVTSSILFPYERGLPCMLLFTWQSYLIT